MLQTETDGFFCLRKRVPNDPRYTFFFSLNTHDTRALHHHNIAFLLVAILNMLEDQQSICRSAPDLVPGHLSNGERERLQRFLASIPLPAPTYTRAERPVLPKPANLPDGRGTTHLKGSHFFRTQEIAYLSRPDFTNLAADRRGRGYHTPGRGYVTQPLRSQTPPLQLPSQSSATHYGASPPSQPLSNEGSGARFQQTNPHPQIILPTTTQSTDSHSAHRYEGGGRQYSQPSHLSHQVVDKNSPRVHAPYPKSRMAGVIPGKEGKGIR